VVVVAGEVGGVLLGEVGVVAGVDAGGDVDFGADAVGVALVGDASCVGVGDCRWLGVGCADLAWPVCDPVTRLVPVTWPPA
jgi:hypothetical protein